MGFISIPPICLWWSVGLQTKWGCEAFLLVCLTAFVKISSTYCAPHQWSEMTSFLQCLKISEAKWSSQFVHHHSPLFQPWERRPHKMAWWSITKTWDAEELEKAERQRYKSFSIGLQICLRVVLFILFAFTLLSLLLFPHSLKVLYISRRQSEE